MAPKRKSSGGDGDESDFEKYMPMVQQALKNKDYGLDRKLSTLLQKLGPGAMKDDILSRHAFQDEVVNELEDTFLVIQEGMRTSLEEAVAAVEKVEQDRMAAMKEVEVASAALDEANAVLNKAVEAVTNAEHDVEKANEANDSAKKEHKQSDKQIASMEKGVAKVKDLTTAFRAAVAGGPEAEGVGDLKKMGQELELLMDVPESLAKAAPTVLRKAPEDRLEFDKTVLQTMNDALGRALSRAEEDKATAELARQKGDAHVAEMAKLFEGACTTLAENNNKRNDASDAVKAAEKAKTEKEKIKESYGPLGNEARDKFNDAEERAVKFAEEMSAFRFLQARNESFEPPRNWSPVRPARRPALVDEEPWVNSNLKKKGRHGSPNKK